MQHFMHSHGRGFPAFSPATAPTADTLKTFPLTMASDNEPVCIHSLHGGKSLVLRLTELGLNQGAEVRVVQRQGGSVVVARGDTRIALGAGMAAKILVAGADT